MQVTISDKAVWKQISEQTEIKKENCLHYVDTRNWDKCIPPVKVYDCKKWNRRKQCLGFEQEDISIVLPDEVLKWELTEKQRRDRARQEYLRGMKKVWYSIKRNPRYSPIEGMEVPDELMISGIEDGAPEGGREIQEAWNEGLNKLLNEIGDKYHCLIEHEDGESPITVICWEGKKVSQGDQISFVCGNCKGSGEPESFKKEYDVEDGVMRDEGFLCSTCQGLGKLEGEVREVITVIDSKGFPNRKLFWNKNNDEYLNNLIRCYTKPNTNLIKLTPSNL